MSDHLYIKCQGELSSYSPYKVYSEDDWMTIMYSPDGRYENATLHDLNVWWDDLKEAWRWTIYPLHRVGRSFQETDTQTIISSGNAEIAEGYAGH